MGEGWRDGGILNRATVHKVGEEWREGGILNSVGEGWREGGILNRATVHTVGEGWREGGILNRLQYIQWVRGGEREVFLIEHSTYIG